MTKDNDGVLRCAEEYADAVADHRLESLYGTSKAYTLGKAKDRDEAHAALKAAIEAKDALLRQVVAAHEADDGIDMSNAVEAIIKELEGKS